MKKDEMKNTKRRKKSTIAFTIIAVLLIIILFLLYNWVQDLAMVDDHGHLPFVEITLKDYGNNDELIILHAIGEKWDWSNYRFIILNNSNENDSAIFYSPNVKTNVGDEMLINRLNTPHFDDINYQSNRSYHIEIYDDQNIRRLNRVDVICI